MITFKTHSKNGNFAVTLPTDLKDITEEYLKAVTKEVFVAENYSLIGLCYREKLSTIIFNAKNNKPSNIVTVPIYIKSNNNEQPFTECGNKLVVSGSQLALGHHVNCVMNTLTINKFLYYIEGDNNAYQNALREFKDVYCYFLEFKIIPNCDIVGVYANIDKIKDIDNFNNPFKVNVLRDDEWD